MPISPRAGVLALLAGSLALPAGALEAQGGRPGAGRAASAAEAPSDSALLAALTFRAIGPAVMSGRIVDLAIADAGATRRPGARLGRTMYAASATGGVWKTTNAGVTWAPVFDAEGTISVGDVTVAPSDPSIVWVGTGEPNNMRSSSWGDGVYKSTDGGQRWTHMGLRASQHVGRIVVHPTNPDVVYVAALGPLWASGGERGLYRTRDGGRTWQRVLETSEHTGVTDVVMDPSDPDVLYAATLQRQRTAYSYVGGGPESGIWKSIDGGDTWRRLTSGLPTSDLGRIGLDVAASRPATIYAVVEGKEAGVYRSDDAGASWRRTSPISSIPWYFGQIRVDPTDPETVYHLGVALQRSTDGGRSFSRIARSVHADQHALWIDPQDPDHLVLGNDGGLYVSHDAGETWEFADNLPVSQFYAIGVDMRAPFYHVYGGLQDNSTWGGPVRTRSRQGIANPDWYRVAGGDGFYAVIDPVDSTIVFAESQNGGLVRFDAATGERKNIKPEPPRGAKPYRWNWSAPILLSPHDSRVVYFAANHLFRSDDRGDSWRVLGPDLTRQRNRDSLPLMGRVWPSDAVARHQGTADYGNVSTIDESPLRAGLLYAGTDDGVISVSSDTGRTWTRVERFPGVPDETYVSRVVASRHDADVAYATFDGHRSNDFRPYVYRTADRGRSWTPITANLPVNAAAYVIREHPRTPELLVVGTEFGAFVSSNRGGRWTKLTGGLPTIAVHDVVIHPRDNDLLLGTHGRGIFVLDDMTPLEHIAGARDARTPTLFPTRPALLFTESDAAAGGPDGAGATGDRGFNAPNPPYGAPLTVLRPAGVRGEVELAILDEQGALVRRLEVPARAGLHRLTWDLRADAPYVPRGEGAASRQGGAPRGVEVLPGRYTAELRWDGGRTAQPLEVRADPAITLAAADWAAVRETRARAAAQLALAATTVRAAEQARAAVAEARGAIRASDAPASLAERAESLQRELDALLRDLRGGRAPARGDAGEEMEEDEREEAAVPPVLARLSSVNGQVGAVRSPATAQQRRQLDEAAAELATLRARLDAVLAERLPAFNRSLDAAGVPWTPGRTLAAPAAAGSGRRP